MDVVNNNDLVFLLNSASLVGFNNQLSNIQKPYTIINSGISPGENTTNYWILIKKSS